MEVLARQACDGGRERQLANAEAKGDEIFCEHFGWSWVWYSGFGRVLCVDEDVRLRLQKDGEFEGYLKAFKRQLPNYVEGSGCLGQSSELGECRSFINPNHSTLMQSLPLCCDAPALYPSNKCIPRL